MAKKKDISERIEEEYITHNPEEDDEMYLIKEALKNALTPLERKIYITYLEKGTYADTAKSFKVSTPTLCKYISGLKDKIIDYVDNNIRLTDN